MAVKTALLARSAAVTALIAYIGAGGKLTLYDGAVPTDADTALGGGNHALVTFTVPSWSVSGDTATAAAIAAAVAIASGVAAFFRQYQADGVTCGFQGTVGTAGADCLINDTTIVSGAAVSMLAADYQLPA
jgi:hypothetical protein